MNNYTTFLRSARNFTEFASAEKIEVETGLTGQEAFNKCQDFNSTRTEEQIEAGTKMEFIAE